MMEQLAEGFLPRPDFDAAQLRSIQQLPRLEQRAGESGSEELVGKPVIKGTRLKVEFVFELLSSGWSEDQILAHYPGVTVEDIGSDEAGPPVPAF